MRHPGWHTLPCTFLGLALAVGLASGSGAQSRSPWEQHDGLEMTPANPLGLLQLECLPNRHGHECEYTVATIPPAEDPGWGPAPNPSRIDFSLFSRLCSEPVHSCIYNATPENLPYADFTYFQTFVDVPSNVPITRFTIDFQGMDDGSRVSLFNSAYPLGIVVPGSYVYYDQANEQGGSGTTDLKDLVVAGETNRVVVTQVDDCCPGNEVQSAIVTLNDLTLGIFVDSFLLPARVKFKPNANPAKTSFVASGTFDAGSGGFDPGEAGTLEVGGFAVPVPGFVAKGKSFAFEEGGVSLKLKPSPDGSSRGRFKLSVVGDLSGAVNVEGPVRLRFANGALDARGQVSLEGGRFKLGGKRGALMSPVVYIEKLKATLADGGPDTLKLRARFLTGDIPDDAPEVTFSFGESYAVTLAADDFTRSRDRWTASRPDGGGTVSVVLDYRRDLATVEARGVELGDIAQGAAPLGLGLAVGVEVRETQVRAVRAGQVLRY